MSSLLEKTVLIIASFRILSGCIEILAAFLILKYNEIEKALIINSSLAIVGPIILILTTTIGLIGLTDKMSLSKFLWIALGITILIYGVKK
ncbi:YqhV family protein [Aquibacillus kalidii]|uniref:YqhV family protein n=1 Tax=Aquibacillus kalidii TaxID=2762597 RepID=UPI0016453975|nr:YqhV family protein [Aquibacillus kalidii]